jgi:acetamidase/formamidase
LTDTLIKVDLNESPYTNEKIHNRWHPDIPMADWVEPGDDFKIETYDWTGGQIKNDDDAADVRDVDLNQVHFLSGPIGVKGAEPGDLLVVDILDIGAFENSLWGFNGFFSKNNGGGFLTDHFPLAQKSIWDFKGMFTQSRHVPGVKYAGLIHPGLIGCLPDHKMLDMWNSREKKLFDTDPDRVPPLANPIGGPVFVEGARRGDVLEATAGGLVVVQDRSRTYLALDARSGQVAWTNDHLIVGPEELRVGRTTAISVTADNQLTAFASGDVDTIYAFGIEQFEFAEALEGEIVPARTAQTVCCRFRVSEAPL